MPAILHLPPQDHESIAEVLRLFYGGVELTADSISAGTDGRAWHFVETLQEAGTVLALELREGERVLAAGSCPLAAKRRERKRLLYIALEELLDLHFPWGSLTGIRPTLVARQCLDECGDYRQALRILVERWRLSEEKAEKALFTALAEDGILEEIPEDAILVYAGIPFCPSRCSYCSFISRDAGRQTAWLTPYVDAMIREIETVAPALPAAVDSFYLGGGTPTSISDADFDRLLTATFRALPLAPNAEITVEAGRPDTITEGKLEIMAKHGVSKICINPQTLKDETLALVGRLHTADDVFRVFHLARSYGFKRINMDLILGLPGEGPADFLKSLDGLLELGPESITTHCLALKRSARLQEEEAETWMARRFPDADYAQAMTEADRRLYENNYSPYYLYRQKNVRAGLENTGFSKVGEGSRYNVGMMSDRRTVVAFGSGASSKWVTGSLVERLVNSKDLRDYTERIESIAAKKLDFVRTHAAGRA